MSRNTTKPKKLLMRPAKTQISLGIRPDWSESLLSAWRNLGVRSYSLSAQWRLWSYWADAGCPVWSESWLGAHITSLVLSCCGLFIVKYPKSWNGRWRLTSELWDSNHCAMADLVHYRNLMISWDKVSMWITEIMFSNYLFIYYKYLFIY